jgi:glycosyltransferase involved in cell wall biosynthesis
MDIFSLDRWLLHDEEHDIMPAVTNLLNYLGTHPDHRFTAFCVHPEAGRVKVFPNGSEIRIIKSPIQPLYARKLVAQQQLYKIGMREAKKQPYDIVYGLSVYALAAKRIGQKAGIKSVGRLFGSLVWDVLQKRQYLKLYTRHILQYLEIKYPCDITIATEDGTEIDRAFAKLNPRYKDLHLLYNGVNDTLRQELLGLPLPTIEVDKAIHFLSMGRLTYWKRHDLVIDLVYSVRQQSDLDIRLTIVGKGEEEASLRQLVKVRQLEDVVSFIKPVPRSEIAHLISKHHAAVLLYNASNLGNVMWECSLAGRLIMTRTTGKTDQIFNNENAIVWQEDDVSKLAHQIIQAISQDGIGSTSRQVRADVDQLLPTWAGRIESEIELINTAVS